MTVKKDGSKTQFAAVIAKKTFARRLGKYFIRLLVSK
jgi:hypothetical protein